MVHQDDDEDAEERGLGALNQMHGEIQEKGVESRPTEDKHVCVLLVFTPKFRKKGTRELEASKIVSSRDRSDVNRYQPVLMRYRKSAIL